MELYFASHRVGSFYSKVLEDQVDLINILGERCSKKSQTVKSFVSCNSHFESGLDANRKPGQASQNQENMIKLPSQ